MPQAALRLDVLHFVTFCCIPGLVGVVDREGGRGSPSDLLASPLGTKGRSAALGFWARWWVLSWRWSRLAPLMFWSLGFAAWTKDRLAAPGRALLWWSRVLMLTTSAHFCPSAPECMMHSRACPGIRWSHWS